MPMSNIIVTGSRLHLRQAEERDIDYIMSLEEDPENLKFIVPFTREMHLAVIRSGEDSMDVLVERKDTGEPVGYLWVAGLRNTSHEIEWTHVIIGKKGQGYGHEAMKLLKLWTFEVMKAHRAWMDCKDYNARALHLYEAEGMVREGLIRETILTEGRYENLVILGILDREYRARRAQGLELPVPGREPQEDGR